MEYYVRECIAAVGTMYQPFACARLNLKLLPSVGKEVVEMKKKDSGVYELGICKVYAECLSSALQASCLRFI